MRTLFLLLAFSAVAFGQCGRWIINPKTFDLDCASLVGTVTVSGDNTWTGNNDFTGSTVSLPAPWVSTANANTYTAGKQQTFVPDSSHPGSILSAAANPTGNWAGALNIDLSGGLNWSFANSKWQTISTAATANRTFALPDANSNSVIPDAGAANNFLTAISAGGIISKAQPAFTNLSGSASTGQVTGNFSGTCNSGTYLRGDGACAAPSGGNTAPTVITTDVSSGADTNEDTMMTTTLGANYMASGKYLVIKAHMKFVGTSGFTGDIVKLYFGSTVVCTDSGGLSFGSNTEINMEAWVYATGATTQKATCVITEGAGNGAGIVKVTYSTPGETLSGTIIVKGTGQSVLGDVAWTQRLMSIEPRNF